MSELFLDILNVSIMAGWTVLAVLILRLVLKKAPAWTRCALWAVVGLRLVWPFYLESSFSLIPSTRTLPEVALYSILPEVSTGVEMLDEVINPSFSETFASDWSNSVNPLQVYTFICGVVWLVGVAVMAVYAIVSYLRLRRQVSVSLSAGENVYLCDRVQTPFILGIVKPKIYLPSDLAQDKWEYILAHERAHLARKDHWWKPVGFALLAVHWFNPLLWLAYVLLCRDMEQACDQRVIHDMAEEEKKNYTCTLLECSVSRRSIGACPLAFGETGVKQRIKAVLDYKKPALWIIIAAVVVCAAAAVCFLTQPVSAVASPDASQILRLKVERIDTDCLYATDANGDLWRIMGEGEHAVAGYGIWVCIDEEPTQINENTDNDGTVKYEVTPQRCWAFTDSDLSTFIGVYDICSYDIDRDGTVEQLILSGGPTSGILTYELSVWNGSTCESSMIFISPYQVGGAFCMNGDQLQILTPDQKYLEETWQIHTLDVTYFLGTITITENGEPLNLLGD